MSIASEDLLVKALELPEADRAELAHRLLRSLEPEISDREPGYEEAWAALIEERSRSIDEGRATLIPWEEARVRLRRSFAKGRES